MGAQKTFNKIHHLRLKKLLTPGLGLGGTKIKDLVVGATWPDISHPAWLVPSGVMHLDFPPEYAVPIMAKLGSSYWVFFQANLILLNHPHRPSLAKFFYFIEFLQSPFCTLTRG